MAGRVKYPQWLLPPQVERTPPPAHVRDVEKLDGPPGQTDDEAFESAVRKLRTALHDFRNGVTD